MRFRVPHSGMTDSYHYRTIGPLLGRIDEDVGGLGAARPHRRDPEAVTLTPRG